MVNADTQMRCGFVAILGAPNAGKSTLVNRLVGAKVSIVTHKVQTTRTRIRGVALRGASQIIFIDTPGIFAPKRRLDRAMVDAAWAGAADAEDVILLIDAAHFAGKDKGGKARDDTMRIVEGLKEAERPAILVLNKIDAMKREQLLALTSEFAEFDLFEETFMISAQDGDGVDDLLDFVAGRVPEGPWHYAEDQVADITERLLAAEVTREKLILRLHDELPYDTTVETESWQSRKDGSVRIEQIIYVERDSQKAIVLGKGGATIKEIGAKARADLEEMMERRVHLFLHVKVREGWGNERARYRNIGLDFPTDG